MKTNTLSSTLPATGLISFIMLALSLGLFNKAAAQNADVVWTQTVLMDAAQAGSGSGSSGLAILRVSSDMTLTYKIIVHQVDGTDRLTNAHIHYGAPGQSGAAFIPLYEGVQNLGKNVTLQLSGGQFNTLVHDTQPIYINVHSEDYPLNVIRGQIR